MTDLFYRACERGDLDEIKRQAAKNDFNINLLDNFDGVGAGFSGLHYAARAGQNDVIKYICSQKKGKVDCKGSDGGTPLHWACRSNKPDTVKLLLELGAKPDGSGKFGRNPLHVSTSKGHVECLKVLLTAPDVDVNLSDNLKNAKFGTTALHLAAANNTIACLKALLNAGANVNALSSKRQTPLHLACCSTSKATSVDTVELLLKAGSDISAKDIDHATPLLHACYNGNLAVVKRLASDEAIDLTQDNEAGETALHWAAAGGWLEIVQILVDDGANINVKSAKGFTPLHFAAKNGHCETCKALVNMQCDIEAQDKLGQSALALAGRHGQCNVVKALIEVGASMHTRDNQGASPLHQAVQENRADVTQCLTNGLTPDVVSLDYDHTLKTPLHVAAEKGHHVCLKFLLEAKYDMSKKNKDGFTPVHVAAREGRIETVRELISTNKECVKHEDDLFNTPLHRAAKYGFVQTCRLLIDAGADVNKGNITGVTPLHFAASTGGSRACSVLLQRGASVNALDNNDDTPLHYATRAGDADSTRILVEAGAKLQQENQLHENPLLTAIKSNNNKCVSTIVDAPHWRASFEDKRGPEATEELSESGWQDSSTLHQLIIHFPEHARSVFDKCTSADDDIPSSSEEYWVKFDYSLLEGQINHPFFTMLENERTELLDHPLVSSLLGHKWAKYGRKLYYANLVFYFCYLIPMTWYCVDEKPPESESGKARASTKLAILAAFIIVFCAMRLFLEAAQMVMNVSNYWTSPTNYIELALYVMSMYFVSHSLYRDDGPNRTEWEFGCFVVVFAWLCLALFLRKCPTFGSRIIMFTRVFGSFLKVFPFIMIFLVAYSLGFYMCLGDQYGTFRSVGYSMLKSHIMFLGEINFDMYFVPTETTNEVLVKYPYATNTILPLFIICMPLVLMNLLVGLAVDDISEALAKAKLEHSARLVAGVFNAQLLLPKREWIDKRHPTTKLYPNKKTWYYGAPFDFKAEEVEEILIRKQQHEEESKNNAGNKILSSLAQIKEQLSVLSSAFYENASSVNTSELDINSIQIAISKQFDKEF